MKGVLLAGLLAVLASAMVPSVASAGPEPGAKKKGFRLFARALGAMTVNRVYCGLASAGQICVDSTNSSTIGGGFWPKGTADQYVFNSGLQIAGIISGGPWNNDTVGGFFFDPKGTTEHGEQVQPIYNASNPADLAAWPEAACVPFGDDSQLLFDDLLVTDPTNTDPAYSYPCRKTASQGDVWFMSWEGNTGLRAGRKHPLGIVAEQRGMGWNFPAGNEDIIYFIYTFYNVSTTDPAAYAAHRPSIRPILVQKANDLHAGAASLGVDLPTEGYTINNMFAAFAADMDVGDAGSNYASVNLPFALGYTYDHAFSQAPGWTFDPSLFSAPFFPGAGFIGVKYLKAPTGEGKINLFGNTFNGSAAGIVNDARDVSQLYRYLSGTTSTSAGDQPCNTGNQALTRICYVKRDGAGDMRFFQSSTPLSLAPGASGSIVVAYIFAAPVITAGCSSTCDVGPGDPTRLSDPVRLATGANTVDSLTGFRRWVDNPLAPNDTVEQSEFTVVKGSLLGKASVAQTVFDNKFLLPFAPAAVDFFLVPGDNQVTVMWKPTASEASGDPFYAISSQAKTSAGTNNPLYDPNYRQFDVEGYRVYRGRVDAPNELSLLAQYDYAGTVIEDYTGIVNPTDDCAPEYGLTTGCPGLAPNLKNGVTLTAHNEYDLVGEVVQLQAGSGRNQLSGGSAIIVKTDTAVVGGTVATGTCGPRSACPALANTGVPFVYVDRTPRNNFRYFYSVTAFDVNSIESGPTSLESPRNTKSVRPVHAAANIQSEGGITSATISGRGVVLDHNAPMPTLNASTGVFSGPFPASNAWEIGLGAFVTKLLAQPGALSATLDSISLGSAYAGSPIPHTYWFTARANGAVVASFSIPLTIAQEGGVVGNNYAFQAVPVDNALASQFGGSNEYLLPGEVGIRIQGTDNLTLFGRGCVNRGGGRPSFPTAPLGCDYNGSRWFSGANESEAHPNACQQGVNSGGLTAGTICFNNAGKLDGVTTISQNQSYWGAPGAGGRVRDGITAGVKRAADVKVYWGAAGHVDSVIDVTHNVPVPGPADGYATHVGASWGILNASATSSPQQDGTASVTTLDMACVEPFRTYAPGGFVCAAGAPAATLSATAVPGPVAFYGNLAFPPAAGALLTQSTGNNGFVMYVNGDIFAFGLTGGVLPAAGTVWTLRSYVGGISGGVGLAGNEGPYEFHNDDGSTLENGNPNKAPARGWLPYTAVGTEIAANYSAVNSVLASASRDLRNVHTVPDPYYVTSGYEQTTDSKIIKFVNLPTQAIIRIYSSSGVLVNLIEHPGANCQNVNLSGTVQNPTGGECTWNVRNRNNQVVASGVYFYHIESNVAGGTARKVGRMTIVNFAQ
jgi:hypothetical protein